MNILPKKCSVCGEWKNRSEFHKYSKSKDGLKGMCKACSLSARRDYHTKNAEAENARSRKYQQDNAEKLRARAAQYQKDHPAEAAARRLKWYLSNIGKAIENAKAWKTRNPQKKLEGDRNWRAAHPEKSIEYHNNRRARESGNGGSFTAQEWQALKEFYDRTCLCCDRREPEIKLEPDHVLPIALGGANSIDNIQPLCRSCNAKKNKKHIDYRERYR